MKLNVMAFAIAGGILWGASVCALTWMALLGYGNVDAASIAKSYYIGFTVTPVGSVIGAIYGFFDAGIACAIFALLYNKLIRK